MSSVASVSNMSFKYLFLASLLNLAAFINPSKLLALSPTLFIDNNLSGDKSKYLDNLLGNVLRKSAPTPIIPVNKLSSAFFVNTAFDLLIPFNIFLATFTSVSLPNNFFAIALDASPTRLGAIGTVSCLPCTIACTTSSVKPYRKDNTSSTPAKLPLFITDVKTVFIKFLSSIAVNNLNNSGGAWFNPGKSINTDKSLLATKASNNLSPLFVSNIFEAVLPNINFLASFLVIVLSTPPMSILPPLIVWINCFINGTFFISSPTFTVLNACCNPSSTKLRNPNFAPDKYPSA